MLQLMTESGTLHLIHLHNLDKDASISQHTYKYTDPYDNRYKGKIETFPSGAMRHSETSK